MKTQTGWLVNPQSPTKAYVTFVSLLLFPGMMRIAFDEYSAEEKSKSERAKELKSCQGDMKYGADWQQRVTSVQQTVGWTIDPFVSANAFFILFPLGKAITSKLPDDAQNRTAR